MQERERRCGRRLALRIPGINKDVSYITNGAKADDWISRYGRTVCRSLQGLLHVRCKTLGEPPGPSFKSFRHLDPKSSIRKIRDVPPTFNWHSTWEQPHLCILQYARQVLIFGFARHAVSKKILVHRKAELEQAGLPQG